jgi:hypothetical protein
LLLAAGGGFAVTEWAEVFSSWEAAMDAPRISNDSPRFSVLHLLLLSPQFSLSELVGESDGFCFLLSAFPYPNERHFYLGPTKQLNVPGTSVLNMSPGNMGLC